MARLKVTFDKSGKVTNVDVARPSGCSAFDRNAVKAAKKIKFEPAIKNGEAITMVKQVEYVYTRY
jgi:TonB family protein